MASQLRARCLKDHEIVHLICEKYGVQWQQAQIYLRRATNLALEVLNQPKANHICRSVEVYERVVSDPQAKKSEVISARARIDSLLGLDAPRRTELSGPDGAPIQTHAELDLSAVPTSRLKELLLMVEPSVALAGNGRGNGESK